MRNVILHALTRGYGDATITVLDKRVAEDIEAALLPYFAALIAAAGGSVTVPLWDIVGPPVRTVFREDCYEGTRYSVRTNPVTTP